MNERETIYEHEEERLSELWERLGVSPASKGSTQIEREKTESQLNAEIERIKEILAKKEKGYEREDKNCIEKEADEEAFEMAITRRRRTAGAVSDAG